MWNNTKRSIITTKQNSVNTKPQDKVLEKPPFRGADFILPGGLGGWTQYGPAISEITYFTIMRVLSESVGKLPIHVRNKNNEIVNNAAEKLLNIRPNETMSPCELMTYLEFCRNEWGNAYAFCDWSTGRLKSITALDPRCIRIWVDDVSSEILQKIYYTYTTPMSANSYFLAAEDVLHLRNWHLDDSRLIGIPVKDTLRAYMDAAQSGQETQNNLFKNGLISSGVLNYVGDLNEEKKALLLENIKKIGTKNKIIPLPKDWSITTIGNMSLVDAQYLETRRFTSQQIGAAFGVSPTQLNDYSKGSYANSISQQLSFLSDTLMYIGKVYEDELSYKLLSEKELEDGLRIDVDTEAVVMNSPDTMADILTKLVTGSIMKINEARAKMKLSPIDGGDRIMTMPGATTLEKEEVIVS